MQPDDDFVRVVKQLTSKNEAQRSAAEQFFELRGAEAIDPLLGIIARESWRRKWREWAYCTGSLAVLVAGFLLFRAGNETGNVWGPYWFLGFFGWALGGFALLPAYRLQRNAAMALARVDDLRVVGPLIEAPGYRNDVIRPVVAAALIRLLPRLKATDAGLLSETQRQRLRVVLDQFENSLVAMLGVPWWNAEFILTVLKTQEEIGDVKAIPHVRRLAKSAKDPQVRKAAQDCLLSLKEQVQHGHTGQSLLRASDSPPPTETLLRPVSGNTNAEVEQLLRPAATSAGTEPQLFLNIVVESTEETL